MNEMQTCYECNEAKWNQRSEIELGSAFVMEQKLELIATMSAGLESITAQELRDLGYEDLIVENGRITFTGDEFDICRTNLWLRTI